jgi:hypothetical protein
MLTEILLLNASETKFLGSHYKPINIKTASADGALLDGITNVELRWTGPLTDGSSNSNINRLYRASADGVQLMYWRNAQNAGQNVYVGYAQDRNHRPDATGFPDSSLLSVLHWNLAASSHRLAFRDFFAKVIVTPL